MKARFKSSTLTKAFFKACILFLYSLYRIFQRVNFAEKNIYENFVQVRLVQLSQHLILVETDVTGNLFLCWCQLRDFCKGVFKRVAIIVSVKSSQWCSGCRVAKDAQHKWVCIFHIVVVFQSCLLFFVNFSDLRLAFI